jgi:hypothetical protein
LGERAYARSHPQIRVSTTEIPQEPCFNCYGPLEIPKRVEGIGEGLEINPIRKTDQKLTNL